MRGHIHDSVSHGKESGRRLTLSADVAGGKPAEVELAKDSPFGPAMEVTMLLKLRKDCFHMLTEELRTWLSYAYTRKVLRTTHLYDDDR